MLQSIPTWHNFETNDYILFELAIQTMMINTFHVGISSLKQLILTVHSARFIHAPQVLPEIQSFQCCKYYRDNVFVIYFYFSNPFCQTMIS